MRSEVFWCQIHGSYSPAFNSIACPQCLIKDKPNMNDKWKFTAADFACHDNCPNALAARANAKLARLLADAPTVYGFEKDSRGLSCFDGQPSGNDTHTARLLMIEPIARDTAESLWRDLISWEARNGIPPQDTQAITIPLEYFMRARKLIYPKAEWQGPTQAEIERAMRPGMGVDE